MSASAVCTADFSTVVVEAPSDAITSRFNAVLDFILSFVGPQGGGIDVDTVVSFGLSHVGIVMWGPIFLVFLILAALPLCCARCCCTTRCCAPKPEYIVPGYPAKHCDGYGIATLVWFVFWAVLAILVIYLPFAFGAFGSAINEWSCVVVETADTASGLIADYQVSVAVIFDIVIDALATIVTLALNLISDVSADTISINDTITDLSDSINEGCANITTSIEYERLVNATGFEYSCSNLDVASQAAAQIDTIIDALSQASTQITSLQVSVVAQINDVESSVADIFTEIEQTIDTFLADLFNQTLLQNSPPIPIILPEGGTMTYVEVTETATSNFPSIGALMIVFSALGLFFWLIGVLLVGCIKCKAKSGSRLERSDEVKSGCCGRCLSKFGCVCGYWGAFLLCFFAIVFLAVTPVFLDVVAVYHAAPYNLDSALDAMVQAQILAPDNVSVYENAVDECFFGNGQASVILSSFGFDISTILGSFDLSSLDIDQYANVTSEVESAQAAVDSARTDLENFKFTSQDLAYADDAADNCCNYGDRIPAVWIKANTGTVLYVSGSAYDLDDEDDDGNAHGYSSSQLPLNEWTTMKFQAIGGYSKMFFNDTQVLSIATDTRHPHVRNCL